MSLCFWGGRRLLFPPACCCVPSLVFLWVSTPCPCRACESNQANQAFLGECGFKWSGSWRSGSELTMPCGACPRELALRSPLQDMLFSMWGGGLLHILSIYSNIFGTLVDSVPVVWNQRTLMHMFLESSYTKDKVECV